MNCKECGAKVKKFGKDRSGTQRYRCTECGKTFMDHKKRLFESMTISEEHGLLALKVLIEGNSIRSTERLTGIHRDTIMKLQRIVGANLEAFSEQTIKDVPVGDVQADEVWSFVGAKQKNLRKDSRNTAQGDAWTFTAIERNTKLILAWHLGKRTTFDTFEFVTKIDRATKGNFQITTDGFRPYIDAVSFTLGAKVDFAQLIKVYRQPREGEQRYSPAEVVEAVPVRIYGDPDPSRICTSHIERSNLTLRMGSRRFTRLTNGFSKKWRMLHAALALHFAFYNFCRVHQTLKVTPAMESGLTDHIWTLRELVEKSNGCAATQN